tara:strand:+ start:976 stop:1218 length:243 start_codon:yes stop_codon:yes gene_type:complete
MKHFIAQIYKGQKIFGEDIAAIINSVLLTIVYILGIGLTSLTAKILRKSFLDLKPSPRKKTYWQDLNITKRPLEEYYRQF